MFAAGVGGEPGREGREGKGLLGEIMHTLLRGSHLCCCGLEELDLS